MHHVQTEQRLPRELEAINGLPKFISDNDIKLFSKDEYSKQDIIDRCIEQYGADGAFYIVDLGKLKDQFALWTKLFPEVKPHYAVKCCPNPMILKTLGLLGCNFDCASKQEIINVNDAGVDSSRIIYANPVKDPNFVKFARNRDVNIMTFDDEAELYKIKLYHPNSKLLLRIKTDDSNSVCKLSAKFGCYLKDAAKMLEKAKELSIDIAGVSFHAGSQCKDPMTFIKAIRDARDVFKSGEDIGMRMNILDIGGGFPGAACEGGAPIEEIAKVIADTIQEYFGDVKDLELISEPGRFFASQSHILIANIVGKRKVVEGSEVKYNYYIGDGVYGGFNCMPYDGMKPNIAAVKSEKGGKLCKSRIYGPTVDDVDVMMTDAELPELMVGDWCYVDNFGAYTAAAASDYGFGTIKPVYIMHY